MATETHLVFAGKYISIFWIGDSLSKKTNIYSVYTNSEKRYCLGSIEWYGAWRRYAFRPMMNSIFEETCLRDIAEFIQAETSAHKQRNKASKEA